MTGNEKMCVYVGFVHLIPIGNEKWVAGYNIIYHPPLLSLIPSPLFPTQGKLWAEIFLSFYCWGKGKFSVYFYLFIFSIHDFESLSSGQLASIDTIDQYFFSLSLYSKIRIQQSAFWFIRLYNKTKLKEYKRNKKRHLKEKGPSEKK